jgi:hypothetical protein
MPPQFNKRVGKWTHEPRSNLNHKKHLFKTSACTFSFSTKLFQKYKNIFTSLHTQPKPKNIIPVAYLLYCIVIYFIVLHIIFTFTYIHTLFLIATPWIWGHKNEELFCRLLEEEHKELFWLFPESSILTPSFPHGKNLLLLQHSALGVPNWHTCLVSSRLLAPLPGNKVKHSQLLASSCGGNSLTHDLLHASGNHLSLGR